MITGSYFFSTTVDEPLDQAAESVTAFLSDEGFGILTEIDVAATLKEKLDVDFRPYRVLGACNPHFAHEALQAEDKIGTMLLCNVILQETEDGRLPSTRKRPCVPSRTPDLNPSRKRSGAGFSV
jgi:uncharacterized protein (DUF302 family)